MTDSPDILLRKAILNNEEFVEAAFLGTRGNQTNPWARVTIRPVLLKEQHLLQFEYFDSKQAFAKNYREAEAEEALMALVALPFKNVQLSTTESTVRIQYSKKGRPIIHHDAPRQKRVDLGLTHDRVKPGILSEDQAAPFLNAIGVTTADGHVRADQQRKFRQINEFLRLIDETDPMCGAAFSWKPTTPRPASSSHPARPARRRWSLVVSASNRALTRW